ncbi:MAG: hypothetical protein R6X13_03725 [bacterium]
MIAKTLKTGLLVVAVFGLALVGCDKLGVPDVVQTPGPAPVSASAYPLTYDIIAGQHTDIGDLTIHFTYDNVYVTYAVTGDWRLEETQCHIATSLAGIPSNNGGMTPGQFDYKVEHDPMVQTYSYTIPMRDAWRDDCLYLAAHCSAVRLENGQPVEQQTGWSGDSLHPGRNWGLYIRFCIPKLTKLPTFPVEVKLGRVLGNIPATMWLRGIPGGPPPNNLYDVWNGEWPSFCLQTGTYIYGGRWYWATLIPSTAPAFTLPNVIRYGVDNSPTPYDKINYLLNTYHNVHHTNDVVLVDLQNVIWKYRGYNVTLTTQQQAYKDEADALGVGYYPPAGGYQAVFLWIGESVQLTFIEVDP